MLITIYQLCISPRYKRYPVKHDGKTTHRLKSSICVKVRSQRMRCGAVQRAALHSTATQPNTSGVNEPLDERRISELTNVECERNSKAKRKMIESRQTTNEETQVNEAAVAEPSWTTLLPFMYISAVQTFLMLHISWTQKCTSLAYNAYSYLVVVIMEF